MELIINFSDEYNDYVTLKDDNATSYKYTVALTSSHEPEDILYYIRKHEYPDITRGSLDEMNQWIADNPEVEPVPWVSTHPEFSTASGEERATMVTDAKELIVNLTYADIDAHIDNVFGNLNVAQRASLKKLYKATLFLLKK